MKNPPPAASEVCEVYAEPRHRFRLRNTWTNIYEIELPADAETLVHRHSEDTVYFVIADAEVRETFPDKPAITTTARAGGTLCRAHKHEPLVHQVHNIGSERMHLLGAEALARPPAGTTTLPALPAHTPSSETGRFRVFDVATGEHPVPVHYAVYGVLVTLAECTLGTAGKGTDATLSVGIAPGGFVWVEPAVGIILPVDFRGIFAQWI